MNSIPSKLTSTLTLSGILFCTVLAEKPVAPSTSTDLPPIEVTAKPGIGELPEKQLYQLPQISSGISIPQIQETVNIVDAQDSVKYFPSLFVRKRNNGDTQPVLATRTWGVNSSARSLVYADDLLLTALIGNNNTIGAPRWGLVSPEEIERVDFLYGPFAAAYPGNSMGGVLKITTKMPETLNGSLNQIESFQNYSFYKTKDTFQTDQTNLSLGGKTGRLAWLLSGNFQNSYSQPLTWITNSTIPAATTGAIPAKNKLGAAAHVVGAGGLLHTEMANVKAKLALDLTDSLRATYQIGLWNNDGSSNVETYLRDATGKPTFGNVSGFASSKYSIQQTHLSNAFSLKSDTKEAFDWDLAISNYQYLRDIQRTPYKTGTNTTFSDFGKIARLDGTQWSIGDLKGIWRPEAFRSSHEISFGIHADQEQLDNPTYKTASWKSGADRSSELYTNSQGKTRTLALWMQDAWKLAPNLKLTTGGRFERWEAWDGINLTTKQTSATGAITGTTLVKQPSVNASRFSPKVSLNWSPKPEWEITTSFGQAYRFPTVAELYQIVQTGATYTAPNANLKPENVLAEEIAIERKLDRGSVRISLFNENVQDALISQTNLLAATPVNFVTNVDAIRNTGIELAAHKDEVGLKQLSVFGSVTYVDSRIQRDSSWAGTTTAVGKKVPYVPDWRVTLGSTLRPIDSLSITGAIRYSGRQHSTLDNTDVNQNVYGAFDRFMVGDIRIQYRIHKNATLNVGIDNVSDAKYTLFHPFPGRTYTTGIKLEF